MTWTLQQMDVVVTSVTLTINVPGRHTPKQRSVLVAGTLRSWNAVPSTGAHLLLPALSLVYRLARSRPPE